MGEIKVSVVIPVYNHEKYIEQAIESVLMQRVDFEYEVLIGDDCSTDKSLEIINKYQDVKQVTIIPREKNMYKEKIHNSIDLRLRTKGEYIILLEGDDYWTSPDKLQKQVDFLDNNQDYIGCCHRFQVVDKDGNVYQDQDFLCQFRQDNPYTQKVLEEGYMLSHINTLMYRNIYTNKDLDLRFLTEFGNLGGDYIMTAYLILKGKLHCIPEVMSHYRKDVSASSSSYSARAERDNRRDQLFANVCKFEKFLQEENHIDLTNKKKATFASAVFKWYRDKTKANYKVVKNIIKTSGQPVRYTWWMVYLVTARFVKNLMGKTGERVRF